MYWPPNIVKWKKLKFDFEVEVWSAVFVTISLRSDNATNVTSAHRSCQGLLGLFYIELKNREKKEKNWKILVIVVTQKRGVAPSLLTQTLGIAPFLVTQKYGVAPFLITQKWGAAPFLVTQK